MLQEHLNIFVVMYLNNVLIYLKTFKEHQRYIQIVLEIFKQNNVKLALHKAEQYKDKVEFLRVMVSANRVCMLEDKIKAVLKQLTLTSVKEVQAFISFANFYKQFIKNFLRVALLLTKKTKNQDKPFAQDKKAQDLFNTLKRKFTEALILAMYNLEQDTMLETNALDKAIKGCIS